MLPRSANESKKLTLTLFIIQDDFSNGSCDKKDIILQESKGLMYDHGCKEKMEIGFFLHLSTGNPTMHN